MISPLSAVLAAVAMIQASTPQSEEPSDVEQEAAIVEKPDFSTSAPQTVPFRLRDNLVTLEVTIGGRQHVAVLDSGSGALVLDKAFVERTNLRAAEAVGTVAGAGAEAQQLSPVAIPDLRVGPLRFGRAGGYAVDLSRLSSSAGFPVNVLIGAPVFKHSAITVDYRRGTVTFSRSGGAAACARPIPITIVHDVPVVEIELKPTAASVPIRLRLVVDLGTRDHGVLLGGAFARSDAGKAFMAAGTRQQVGHGTGGAVQGSVARAAELRIGAGRYRNQEVALTEGVGAFDRGGFDGSLGAPWWKSGSITFDYEANTVCIVR